MNNKRSDNQLPLRFAHIPGFCDLSFVTESSFVTCGNDGDVRVWKNIHDDDVEQFSVGETATAVAFDGKNLFCSTDAHLVQALTYPDGELNGIVTKFSHQISQIILSKDASKLLIASCDFTVRWVDINDNSYVSFTGHDAPVLSIALDPEEEYFASSSGDGTVKLWTFAEKKCVQTFKVLPKISSFCSTKSLSRCSWKPKKGEGIAIPEGNVAKIYERNSWKVRHSLSCEPVKTDDVLSILSYSSCGNYLACSTILARIFIWNLSKVKPQLLLWIEHEYEAAISALAWNPVAKGELLFCDVEGNLSGLTKLDQPISSSTSAAAAASSKDFLLDAASDVDKDEDVEEEAEFYSKLNSRRKSRPISDEDEDDDDVINKIDNDLFDNENEEDAEPSKKALQRPLAYEDDEFTRTSDIGAIKAAFDPFLESHRPGFGTAEEIIEQEKQQRKATPVPTWLPIPPQRAFIPASTPEHLYQRFMKWNSVGIIRQYTENENSIDVEFHDVSLHHGIHIENTNYSMADLNTEAVIFGAVAADGAPSWDSSKEWFIDFPAGEDIACLCIGSGFLASTSENRIVRIFSIGGLQKEIFSIPGNVVSMAAHGELLAVAYHSGMGVSEDQNIWLLLYRVPSLSTKTAVKPIIPAMQFSLSANTELAWMGFTNSGTFCYMDSGGIVRLLNSKWNFSWLPIANTKEHTTGRSYHVWIVAIHENPCQIRCVTCKSARYPPLLPKPNITILQWTLPLCELETEKAKLEETRYRSELCQFALGNLGRPQQVEAQKSELDCIMKLFVLACKAERDSRALEVAQLMPTSQAIQILINYASKQRRMVLADKLAELAREKAEFENAPQTSAEENEFWSAENDMVSTATASSRRMSLKRPQINSESFSASRATATFEESENAKSIFSNSSRSNSPEFLENEQPLRPKFVKISRSSLSGADARPNPFKKELRTPNGENTERRKSVFDSVDILPEIETLKKTTPIFENKRKRNSDASKITFSEGGGNFLKQAKLSFSLQKTSVATENFNRAKLTEPTALLTDNVVASKPLTAFQLWLEKHEQTLREEFSDENNGAEDNKEEDTEMKFNRFAVARFRMLPTDERKIWSEKAKQSVAQESTITSPTTKRDFSSFAYSAV